MLKFNKTLDLLKKFSKLTDEQYKAILRDSNKISLLDKANLLDEFYKARPDKTEKDLLDQLAFQKTIQTELPKFTINDPKVLNFLKEYGRQSIPRDILFRIGKMSIRAESLDNDNLREFMDNLSNYNLTDILEMYYQRVKYSNENVLTFIDDFQELDELQDKKEQAERTMQVLPYQDEDRISLLNMKISQNLFIILDQISEISPTKGDLPIEDIVWKKLQESLALRKSNIFDFVFENKDKQVA